MSDIEEKKPKKRGRKPKPKTEEQNKPKVQKKRGRKPKPKPPVDKTLPKKKRGRKKKCEMNLDTYKKIAGFNENGESIDTKDNQIHFMEQAPEVENTECENISFGSFFNIKKVNNQNTEESLDLRKIYHKKTQESNSQVCEIDLNGIVDEDEISKVETNDVDTEKKNLYDFFGNLSDEKKQKKQKKVKKITKNIYDKQFEYNSINTQNPDVFKIKILHCYEGKEKELPDKTDVWCWWCCHPFDGVPRFMPTKYDEQRQRYKVTGNFCSWGCAKAFMLYDSSYVLRNSLSMLTSLIRKINGSYYNFPTAPPRSALKVFGGTMTIEEFRNRDKNEYFEINNNIMMLDEGFYIKGKRRNKSRSSALT